MRGRQLFKVIMGLIQPDSGRIILENNSRIGLLPQVINDEVPSLNINVFDFIMSGRPINELNNELQNVYEEISKEQDEKNKKFYLKRLIQYNKDWNIGIIIVQKVFC